MKQNTVSGINRHGACEAQKKSCSTLFLSASPGTDKKELHG